MRNQAAVCSSAALQVRCQQPAATTGPQQGSYSCVHQMATSRKACPQKNTAKCSKSCCNLWNMFTFTVAVKTGESCLKGFAEKHFFKWKNWTPLWCLYSKYEATASSRPVTKQPAETLGTYCSRPRSSPLHNQLNKNCHFYTSNFVHLKKGQYSMFNSDFWRSGCKTLLPLDKKPGRRFIPAPRLMLS